MTLAFCGPALPRSDPEQVFELRITHCDDEHLIRLSGREASLLVEACVMVVLAAESVPKGTLNPELSVLLANLYEHLSSAVR